MLAARCRFPHLHPPLFYGRGTRLLMPCGVQSDRDSPGLRNKQAVVDKDRKSLRGFGQFCSPLCLRAAWPRIRDLQAWAEAVTKNGHSVKQLCRQRVRATAALYHVLIATAGGSSPPRRVDAIIRCPA